MVRTRNEKPPEAVREPGFWEGLGELLFGGRRPLDCVQVEVSSRCPGRCDYCPHTVMQDRWRSSDLDLATFKLLWPLLRRSTRVHLQGWGEPLLNPAFPDMVALARRAGCAVSTTTSGLFLDRVMADWIVDSGMDIVAFSLTGTDAASNALRRGIDFERVIEGVSTLQAMRRERMAVHLEIHFAYLMLASRMEAVRGLPALMHRLGVHAAVISTLDYLPSTDLMPEGIGPHETEKLDRAEAILRETESEARALGLGFHWVLPRLIATGGGCRENIARSVFVSVEGSLSPCVYLNVPAEGLDNRRRVFGNVRERDAVAIWESHEFREFREGLSRGEPDRLCLNCIKRFEI